jgi:hypothetical protein
LVTTNILFYQIAQQSRKLAQEWASSACISIASKAAFTSVAVTVDSASPITVSDAEYRTMLNRINIQVAPVPTATILLHFSMLQAVSRNEIHDKPFHRINSVHAKGNDKTAFAAHPKEPYVSFAPYLACTHLANVLTELPFVCAQTSYLYMGSVYSDVMFA